jgi:prepilin-type N-terminal cleavage/methylation domain-containing protein
MKKSSRKGFTMIEMVVATALIGVVSAMAVPLFGRLQRTQQFRDTTRHLSSALLSAKSLAATGRRQAGWAGTDRVTTAGVHVLSANSYVVFIDRDGVRDGDEIIVKTVILPNAMSIVSPAAGQEIRYRGNGTVANPLNVTLLDTERNRRRTIVISGGGAVRID